MKYVITIGMILLVLSGCAAKKDPASLLINHLNQMEKIFETNQDVPEKLAAELSTYSVAHMPEMQNGVNNLLERVKHLKETPLDSIDLIAKVAQISSIIVNIKTQYGHLLEDPTVMAAFKDFNTIFSDVQNLSMK
ncbi:MAG: hypothetical protein JXJ04_23660 [Spirochaetales bacterium]|nr:hypothetical protein [Spirochaetales bacterium]